MPQTCECASLRQANPATILLNNWKTMKKTFGMLCAYVIGKGHDYVSTTSQQSKAETLT